MCRLLEIIKVFLIFPIDISVLFKQSFSQLKPFFMSLIGFITDLCKFIIIFLTLYTLFFYKYKISITNRIAWRNTSNAVLLIFIIAPFLHKSLDKFDTYFRFFCICIKNPLEEVNGLFDLISMSHKCLSLVSMNSS